MECNSHPQNSLQKKQTYTKQPEMKNVSAFSQIDQSFNCEIRNFLLYKQFQPNIEISNSVSLENINTSIISSKSINYSEISGQTSILNGLNLNNQDITIKQQPINNNNIAKKAGKMELSSKQSNQVQGYNKYQQRKKQNQHLSQQNTENSQYLNKVIDIFTENMNSLNQFYSSIEGLRTNVQISKNSEDNDYKIKSEHKDIALYNIAKDNDNSYNKILEQSEISLPAKSDFIVDYNTQLPSQLVSATLLRSNNLLTVTNTLTNPQEKILKQQKSNHQKDIRTISPEQGTKNKIKLSQLKEANQVQNLSYQSGKYKSIANEAEQQNIRANKNEVLIQNNKDYQQKKVIITQRAKDVKISYDDIPIKSSTYKTFNEILDQQIDSISNKNVQNIDEIPKKHEFLRRKSIKKQFFSQANNGIQQLIGSQTEKKQKTLSQSNNLTPTRPFQPNLPQNVKTLKNKKQNNLSENSNQSNLGKSDDIDLQFEYQQLKLYEQVLKEKEQILNEGIEKQKLDRELVENSKKKYEEMIQELVKKTEEFQKERDQFFQEFEQLKQYEIEKLKQKYQYNNRRSYSPIKDDVQILKQNITKLREAALKSKQIQDQLRQKIQEITLKNSSLVNELSKQKKIMHIFNENFSSGQSSNSNTNSKRLQQIVIKSERNQIDFKINQEEITNQKGVILQDVQNQIQKHQNIQTQKKTQIKQQSNVNGKPNKLIQLMNANQLNVSKNFDEKTKSQDNLQNKDLSQQSISLKTNNKNVNKMFEIYKYNSNEYYQNFLKNKKIKQSVITSNQFPEGKIENIYTNGKREIIYRNGIKKEEIYPDGFSITNFLNGNIKQTLPDGSVIFYYAETQTTQTSVPDGTQVIIYNQIFGDNQLEFHFSNGDKQVFLKDGTQQIIKKNDEKQNIPTNETNNKNSKMKTTHNSNEQIQIKKHFIQKRYQTRQFSDDQIFQVSF